MSDPIWVNISEPGTSIALRPETFVAPWERPEGSAIDLFLDELRAVIMAAQPKLFEQDAQSASMLAVRIVGAVEHYFRIVLAYTASICPTANECSDSSMVSLYAARRYGLDALALAVLDGASLADYDQVKKKTKSLLGIEIPPRSPLDASLLEYAKACHVRHSIAHARGLLGGGNLIAFDIRYTRGLQQVILTFDSLQDIVAICENVVREYNRHVFRRVLERWFAENKLVGDWAADRRLIEPLFELYRCKADSISPNSALELWETLASIL